MNPNKNTQNLDEITTSSIITNNITVTSGLSLEGVFNAKGDLLTTSDGNTTVALGVGSNDEYLASNSSTPTGLEWKQIDHTALSNIGTNSHATIDAHIASTSNPHSVAFSQVTPLTTKGDIIARTSSSSTRFAIGSNDQYLAANSATATGLEWKDPNWVEAITCFDQEMPRFTGTEGQLQQSGITIGGAPSLSVYGGAGVLGANVDSSVNRWSRLDIANIRCYNSDFYTTITRQPGGTTNWTYGIPGTTPVTGNAIRWGASSNEWFIPCEAAASSTDNAIPRFDGTNGRLIQDSDVSIDDDGHITPNGSTQDIGTSSDPWRNGYFSNRLYMITGAQACELKHGGTASYGLLTPAATISNKTVMRVNGVVANDGSLEWFGLDNSTYTPTSPSSTTLTVGTIYDSKITRIGERITIVGCLTFTPTTSMQTTCQVVLTLPSDASYAPADNFAAITDIIGVGNIWSDNGSSSNVKGTRVSAVVAAKTVAIDMIVDAADGSDIYHLSYTFTYDK